MAPGQRTFTIVPNPLGMQGLQQRPAGESVPTTHRPMTSKQAQKLHRQATKVPKMTRAEERAWEKKMQADIKEEKEKQRQSNKARMLRDKKKEREQKIIEAKKRKGLPIVDVRPSQDLITRFVRGNDTAKKRDSAEAGLDMVREESPACDSATEAAAGADTHGLEEEEVGDSDAESEYPAQLPELRQSPSKRQRTESPEARHSTGSPLASPRRSPRASNIAVSTLRVLDHKSRESSMDVDDPAIEHLLTTQILEESISAANSSAVQQRSPVRSNGITSLQQVSQGKENIPPISKATITSECCVKKSPQKLAQARPSPQRSSPKADSVTFRKGPADRPLASPVIVKRRGLSQSRISAKPSDTTNPGTQQPQQVAASNVGKPPRYESALIEAATSPAPRTSPDGAITGSVNSNIKHMETGSLTSRAPMVASQRPTAAPAPNVELQNSAGRKPLHETTLNKIQPARAVSRPYATMRKSPPVRATARPVPVAAKQSMPPPPQPGNRFQRPPQEINRPKFLLKHLQTPQARPPVGRMSHSPAQDPRTIPAESAPPSSTQLFLHSFIDDIMPSPSQEARELQGMAPPPAPVQQAKPPVWKPPPRFATRGPQVVKRAMPPPPPPPQPKAPGVRQTPKPQAPLPPLQLRQTIEPVLPFFSTQDFMLSSQDIRDLQETTETPSKLPGKDTSRATTTRATYNETPSRPQQAPSEPNRPAAQTRVKVPSQESTVTTVPVHRPQFPQPPRYVLRNSQPRTPVCTPGSSANPCQLSQPHPQASRLNPVLINPSLSHVAGPSQRNLRSSSLAQPETVAGAASPKPPALGQKRSGTKSPPQQSMQAVEHEPAAGPEHAPKQETLKPSSSPKKGRFFTASNEQVQLAMEKSLRTHKEEQRKREAEQRALKIEEERRARQQRALVLEAERKARERHRHEEDLEPYWEPEYYCADYGTDAVTDETTEATDDPTDDGSEYDSAEEEGRQQRRTETRDRRREEATERLNERREAAEYERDVLADFNAEHQYDADRQALQEAANELRREELRREELKAEEPKTEDLKGTVKEDPYDLDADFEELLGAEFDLVDVNPPTCSDHVKKEAKVFMASQETDYGDMDVTLEDLDDFL